MPGQKISSIFSWWNTSLDPIRGKNNTSGTVVKETIHDLCTYCDIVILGEYTNKHGLEKEIDILNSTDNSKKMKIIDLNYQNGNLKFKNLVIYNSLLYTFIPHEEYECSNFLEVDSGYCEGKYRVGQRIRFASPLLQQTLEFYIVHWSMYGEQAGEDKKLSAAITLRNEIKKHKEYYQICVGDFNTEPYSRPLCHLGSSRSEEYVKQYGGFYNPFWQEMHSQGTINSLNRDGIKYFYPTFDQILINQSLLNDENIGFESGILNKDFEANDGEHWPIYIKFDITIQQGEKQNV